MVVSAGIEARESACASPVIVAERGKILKTADSKTTIAATASSLADARIGQSPLAISLHRKPNSESGQSTAKGAAEATCVDRGNWRENTWAVRRVFRIAGYG